MTALTESVDIPPTMLELLGAPPLPVNHGRSLLPLLEGRPGIHRDSIFTGYLENEEAAVRTCDWKFIFCSGKRERKDGFQTGAPTPGRYTRLYDLNNDPEEMRNLSNKKEYTGIVETMQRALLDRFLGTHPEAAQLPKGLSEAEEIEWFLRPRDSRYSAHAPRRRNQ